MIHILFPAAFIPLIALLIWIRNVEKYNRQSWSSIVKMFLWGSTFGAAIALFFNTLLQNYISNLFILLVITAPIIEEISKAVGLRLIKNNIFEIEDGIVYGTVAGFGFAATENLIYGIRFWNEGLIVILSLFYIRTVGSSLLHASSTGLTGYGYSNKILKKHSILKIVPYLLTAIVVHSIFNLFAYSALTIYHIIGVVAAVMFALILFIWMRKKIIILDKIQTNHKGKSTSVKPFGIKCKDNG